MTIRAQLIDAIRHWFRFGAAPLDPDTHRPLRPTYVRWLRALIDEDAGS